MLKDADSVRRVLGGDREAYAELVQRHERAVLAAAWAILGNQHDAQDACQDAFVIAFQKLSSLRNADLFGAWVLKIARRTAVTLRRQRRKTLPLEANDPEAVCRTGDGGTDDRTQLLLAAVMQLPARQRQAILLKYCGGHGADAIAEMTGQPAGTVRSLLSRATARLRERLKERWP
jgi:RNA polymerase sigma-70 factor (ECF subfamily)